MSFDVWKKKNSDGKESGVHDWTSLMGNDKRLSLYHLPEKMKNFLRPETASKVTKIWEDFAELYKQLSNWQPNTSRTEFWTKVKQWVIDSISFAGLQEGYERKRVTPYMQIMVAHIPLFFTLHKTVKIFTGQGVERNNDVTRSIVLSTSNKWDSVGDVLKHESRQWQLTERAQEPRAYKQHKTEYWEDAIFTKRKKTTLPESEEATQTPPPSIQNDQAHAPVHLFDVNLIDFTKMTVPQLKEERKRKGIK